MYNVVDWEKRGVPNRRARRTTWRADGASRAAWLAMRITGGYKPFTALEKYIPKLEKAHAAPAGIMRQLAFAALPPLRHRGHGGGYRMRQRTVIGRAMLNRSRY